MKNKLIKSILAGLLICGGLVGCKDNSGITENLCETHTWDAGVVTKAATTTEEGVMTYTCTVCKTTKTETIPVVAQQKYTVSYDANGGIGAPLIDSNEYVAGDRVTVKENTFTAPEGKEFIAWNEAADESGAYYRAGSSFKIYEDVTLYAQWDDIQEVDTRHNIKVNAGAGITYTLSKTKADAGDEITLNFTVAPDVILNGAPTSSQVSLRKVSDTEYKFTMPDKNVTIDIKVSIDGDVILIGELSAKLTDDDNDGVFEVELPCNEQTVYEFTYVVKDNNGSAVSLSSLKLDETKCDAAITFSTSGSNQLRIAGGFTYTFYYDSNLTNYNCYVRRKTVDVLPCNSNTLYNLFDGSMRSNSTVHPQGLTSVHYTKTVSGNDSEQGYKVTNTEYDYKKISNTESFAVAINKLNDNKKSYVYKNIDTNNDVYSIINTYTMADGNNEASDNVWTLDPYGSIKDDGPRYLPYSAKQDIVDNKLYRDTSRYQITEREAYRNVNMAAHYGSALEREIWQAIRGDFTGSATINAANAAGSHCHITSTTRTGGFQVVLDSQLEYNHEESGSTADVTQQYAFIYNATMVFKANGDLYSMEFVEKYYTKSAWDFTNHRPASGVTPLTTTINVTNGFDESFNRATVLGSFNPDDYFISTIAKLSFYDKKVGPKLINASAMNYDDSLDIYEYLGGGSQSELVDEFTYFPETALDAWQYGCVSAVNKGVIDKTPWGYKTVGTGTTEATFSNHLENITGPSKTITITVFANGTMRSFYVDCTVPGYDSYQGPHADYMYGYAGKTMTFYIDSSQNSGCPITYWMVIKAKDEFEETYYEDSSEYFNVVNGVGTVHDDRRNLDYVKVVGHALTLDFNTEAANALKKQVTVDVIFQSNYYEEGAKPTTLHIVIGPAQAPIAGKKFGTYYVYEDDASKKYEDAFIEFYTGGTGKITEILYDKSGAVTATNVWGFSYTERNNGIIDARIISVDVGESGMPKNATDYTLVIERQLNGTVGVCFFFDGLDIFGTTTYISEDGNEYQEAEGLTTFEEVED